MPGRIDNTIWRTGKPYEWRQKEKKNINTVKVGREIITL